MSPRTFIAVDLREAAAGPGGTWVRQLANWGADVKWVDKAQWHLTLKFLGDVEETELPRMLACVARAAEGVTPFEIELTGAGAFPQPDRPRTVWLGIGEGREALAWLAGQMDAALELMGFAPERRAFHPHLTIGRVRDGRAIPRLATAIGEAAGRSWGRFPVHEVQVLSSELRPAGPRYSVLAHCALAE